MSAAPFDCYAVARPIDVIMFLTLSMESATSRTALACCSVARSMAFGSEVDTAWHWAVATGILVGFVSGLGWPVYVIGYVAVVALAKTLRMRVWQAPLLAMFSVTFLGTILTNLLSLAVLRLSGVSIPIQEAFGLLTLPGVLLNLLFSVPVYAVMRDLAHWTYPSPEAE